MDTATVNALSPEFLLGALFVTVYAVERFNTPHTNRALTTAGRYYAAVSVYLGTSLLFYWVFTRYPQFLLHIKPAEAAGTGVITPQQHKEPVVEVAMLLSVLLSRIPVLSHLDKKLRTFLQNLAEIPMEAIRLGKLIRRSHFNPTDELRETILAELLACGIDDKDVVFDSGNDPRSNNPHALWVRITALKIGLVSWESQRGFAGFIQHRTEEYKTLLTRYKKIMEVAKNYFSLLRTAHNGDADEPLSDAVSKFQANFVDQADALAKDISLFMACGVLRCQFTHGTRSQALRVMGFEPPPDATRSGLSVNRVLTLFVILVPLLLINFIIVLQHDTHRQALLIMVSMIGATHMTAVVCAIYPKGRWAFFQRGEDGARPVAGYLISGLVAVALAVPVNVAFKTLIFLNQATGDSSVLALAWSNFAGHSYPWMLLTFVSSVTTAFMVDNRPDRRIPPRYLRWLEAIGQAIAFMLGASLVLWWLGDLRPEGRLPDMFGVLCNAAITGIVLGALVPSWYRQAVSRKSAHAAHDIADGASNPQAAGA